MLFSFPCSTTNVLHAACRTATANDRAMCALVRSVEVVSRGTKEKQDMGIISTLLPFLGGWDVLGAGSKCHHPLQLLLSTHRECNCSISITTRILPRLHHPCCSATRRVITHVSRPIISLYTPLAYRQLELESLVNPHHWQSAAVAVPEIGY